MHIIRLRGARTAGCGGRNKSGDVEVISPTSPALPANLSLNFKLKLRAADALRSKCI